MENELTRIKAEERIAAKRVEKTVLYSQRGRGVGKAQRNHR
jgi:hypothetical protein